MRTVYIFSAHSDFLMSDMPGTQHFNLPFETDWPETGNTNARFIHLFKSFL